MIHCRSWLSADINDNSKYNSKQDKKTLSGIISQKYAEKNLMLPVSINGRELTVAIMKPEKISKARELSNVYNHLDISCILVTEEKFTELFEVLFQLLGITDRCRIDQDAVLKHGDT